MSNTTSDLKFILYKEFGEFDMYLLYIDIYTLILDSIKICY